jgi:hypothetical protein
MLAYRQTFVAVVSCAAAFKLLVDCRLPPILAFRLAKGWKPALKSVVGSKISSVALSNGYDNSFIQSIIIFLS